MNLDDDYMDGFSDDEMDDNYEQEILGEGLYKLLSVSIVCITTLKNHHHHHRHQCAFIAQSIILFQAFLSDLQIYGLRWPRTVTPS